MVVVLAVDLFLDGVPEDAPRREARRARASTASRSTGRRPDPALDARAGPADHPPASPPWSARPADTMPATSVSGRGSGPGSTGRIASREGHPDQGRAEARQERGDEDRRRRLRPELPHPADSSRSRPRAAPIAPGSTTSRAARTSASASARTPRSRRPGSPARP